MNQVVVVGSINVDHILSISELPLPGETIFSNGITRAAGGKGANQAVAAARSGAQTSFIGAVGTDAEGKWMCDQLSMNQIDTTCIERISGALTGQAYILLQKNGQNSIILNGGANEILLPPLPPYKDKIADADFLISEFETPVDTTIAAFKYAKQTKTVTILNPAPMRQSRLAELFQMTDIIIPNEIESEQLTGIKVTTENSMRESAKIFHEKGIATVIITLGSRGLFISSHDEEMLLPAYSVTAVDTTAAGDTFIGALSAVLKPQQDNLISALKYASQAAALTVQKVGAFPAIPTSAEVKTSFRLS